MGEEEYHGGVKMEGQELFLKVDDVAEMLKVSKSKAYQIISQCNAELKAQGKIVTAGRVSKRYLLERVYM